MSWSDVLQAVHSVFVDELVEHRYDPKPELGLPLRTQGYVLPKKSEHFKGDLNGSMVSIYLGEGAAVQNGVVLFVGTNGFLKAFCLDLDSFWKDLRLRTAKEFKIRKLICRLDEQVEKFDSSSQTSLPKLMSLKLCIWYPFQVPEGQAFIGVGI